MPENFPLWHRHFSAFVSMSGCLGCPLTDIEVAVGGTTKDTPHFVSQASTNAHIRSERVARICLAESISAIDMLDRVFA